MKLMLQKTGIYRDGLTVSLIVNSNSTIAFRQTTESSYKNKGACYI